MICLNLASFLKAYLTLKLTKITLSIAAANCILYGDLKCKAVPIIFSSQLFVFPPLVTKPGLLGIIIIIL